VVHQGNQATPIGPLIYWWACLDSNQEPDRYERQNIGRLR
jgi:hypothetical protein